MNLETKLQQILNDTVASGEECGCQLVVYRHGELLYDLSAGYTDASRKQKIDSQTLFPVFSVGKGVVTTLMHILAEHGILSYDDPVTKYWPEYGCNGKENTTIRDVLSHRAGLFTMPPELTLAERFDWATVSATLAAAVPEDTVGGKHHYHAYTYGVLTGIIAERAAGKPFEELLKENILEPLQIDTLFFGLPPEKFVNLAKIDGTIFSDVRIEYNEPNVLSGLNPSSNGCMNAGAIARLYASLIGSGADGVRLLRDDTIENATRLCRLPDEPLNFESWDKFGLGYALCGPRKNIGRMFGHGGAAGSEGFADKESGYAVGFTKNRLNTTHPVHPTRNAVSCTLGLPEGIW